RHGATLLLDPYVLFGFDGLMETVAPATPRQNTAGVLIDDEDLAIRRDHVLLVPLVEGVSLEELVQDVQALDVDRVVEVPDPRELLDELDALVGEGDREGLLVDGVVLVLGQARDDLVQGPILVAGRVGRAADDERGAGFVDQDRVDLVDDGEMESALDVFERAILHIVAEVVKAELVILA